MVIKQLIRVGFTRKKYILYTINSKPIMALTPMQCNYLECCFILLSFVFMSCLFISHESHFKAFSFFSSGWVGWNMFHNLQGWPVSRPTIGQAATCTHRRVHVSSFLCSSLAHIIHQPPSGTGLCMPIKWLIPHGHPRHARHHYTEPAQSGCRWIHGWLHRRPNLLYICPRDAPQSRAWTVPMCAGPAGSGGSY